jgi:adenylate cyclase
VDELVGTNSVMFNDWRFDRRLRGLFRRNDVGEWVPIAVGLRALEILAALLCKPGELVSKEALMEAVWPGGNVEANNLTVQMAALRRVLDEGRAGDSCIQTIPGRGYRFTLRVTQLEQEAAVSTSTPAAYPSEQQEEKALMRAPRNMWRWPAVGVCGLIIAVLLLVGWGQGSPSASAPADAPLSIVVLPFENLSGDHSEDYLADAITDDLTSDLSHISGAFVIARESAYTYKGQAIDIRKVGRELGVRYTLNGSVRKLGDVLRVNAQLIETKTGAELWSDRFDQSIKDLRLGQEETVRRIGTVLGMEMIQVEAARTARERPNNPDAFDIVLRARSLRLQPPNARRIAEILQLYEQALQLDPSSVPAMAGLAESMIENQDFNSGGRKDMLERTAELLARARTIEPRSEAVQAVSVHWLQRQDGRCMETADAAQKLIEAYPNNVLGYRALARCLAVLGKADEAIPLIEKSLHLNPRDPWQYLDYARMGHVLALLGRYDESIVWNQRALAADPEASNSDRAWYYRLIAEAYALTGHLAEARTALAEATRLWPYATVRTDPLSESSSPTYIAQLDRLKDGARLAGLRDHAEEDADFSVQSDRSLRQDIGGLTPTSAPGATTIRTDALVHLMAGRRPLVLDTMVNAEGRSIPDAIGLRYVGEGGDLSDTAQDRLRRKMHEVTKGDASFPIVVVGWNSEHFDGRNLALRLAALGYTHIYWYRGGREAWEVRGLPEAELEEDDW